MKKPITDKVEVSVDFPDKAYYGSFDHRSTFGVRADDQGIHIDLERRGGERRHVGFHVHYYLLADLFESIGKALSDQKVMDEAHADALRESAQSLAEAVKTLRTD